MTGCFVFAALAIYLAIDNFSIGFNQYSRGIRDGIVTQQRDVMFRLIPQLHPRLRAEQIEAAATAAKVSITSKASGKLSSIAGVDIILDGNEVVDVRSSNW